MARKTVASEAQKGKSRELIAELKANPTEENWKKARPKILKEGKYYYAFYPKEIKGSMSLKDALCRDIRQEDQEPLQGPIIKKSRQGDRGCDDIPQGP